MTWNCKHKSERTRTTGWFNFIYGLPRREQIIVARTAPVFGGVVGGVILAVLVAPETKNAWLACSVVFFCWGMGTWCGSRARALVKIIAKGVHLQPIGPSWTCALLGGIAMVLAWVVMSPELMVNKALAALGLAVNFSYLGAKLRCRIFRCCESRRKGAIATFLKRSRLLLQEFEILGTVLIIAVALISLSLVGIGISAAVSLCGHGVLRGLNWHLRFTCRPLHRLVLDPGVGGICVIGVAALLME